jgi:hypothetical protein
MRAEKAAVDSPGLAAMRGRLSMAQFGLWRFLSQGWMDRGGLWKTVEKGLEADSGTRRR